MGRQPYRAAGHAGVHGVYVLDRGTGAAVPRPPQICEAFRAKTWRVPWDSVWHQSQSLVAS